MAYQVKLQVFEGPFDLLYHLIEKNEIDIYDIPINEVTHQYLEYLKAMEELDLDIASEFLVMAATLLEIKSKMLLPIEKADEKQLELDEADPRNELVRRLLEYKKYKVAADVLKDKEDISRKLYFKPKEEFIFEKDVNSNLLEDVELSDLLKALQKILKGNHQANSIISNFRRMQREAFTIEEKIHAILDALEERSLITFNYLFKSLGSRNEMITTFLALLELIKVKRVVVYQTDCFSDISIELKKI
ncbi:segregation and condensation protein A [Alkaliphilus serpentinus]|uniref:Segregation and condensation protein A n=1 Tax=Alkaliphilus serpentinus TaxID=1482731 RepID=A0A833HN25_9FIRM|nr:segregation/condensation protein A [Alkaliphilus serpentinus]KAB3527367.1 segregation/condensation protein A [Alkaliphilus serpentinus]